MPDEEKLIPPPKPSTPRAAPWTEIESLNSKLDEVIAAIKGMPVPPEVPPTPTPPGPPVPTNLIPITSRLDLMIAKLDILITRLAKGTLGKIIKGFQFTLVGTDSTVILPDNPERSYALIINGSDTEIFLGLDTYAKLDEGILLNPKGGAYEINMNNPYIGSVTGICTIADKRVLTIEAK